MNRKRRVILTLCLTMCFLDEIGPVGAASDPQKAKTKEAFATCVEKVDLSAFKNTQFADCYSAELKRQDVSLNQAFKSLKDRLSDPTRTDQMVKAQQSWIMFRDKWCAFAESSDQAPSHEVSRLDCLVELTKAQAKLLGNAEQ